ncbi:MAG: rubrerythrin family protein [Pseudomonadota bacterium]
MALKGSKTEKNLRDAFAREAQANRRFYYFASKADVEGFPEVAKLFRSTAEDETGHAAGVLEYLEVCGDPVTGLPIGGTRANLRSAMESELVEYEEVYPKMAEVAREEGHDDIADWFETLAKSEKVHADRFRKLLDDIE